MSKIIRLTENQFGEMMVYHGSGSDFDKFNHKKYLSTGAGDQAFGWGTYVTSDEAIGRSYASDDMDVGFMQIFKSKLGVTRNNTLYEVEIPDDNGHNYLEWYGDVDVSIKRIVCKMMKKMEKRFNFRASSGFWPSMSDMRILEGVELYKLLADVLESDKAASLFLMQCGFDGIKYPAGTIWNKPDDASEDAMNYVIFDANKVKIVNKTKV